MSVKRRKGIRPIHAVVIGAAVVVAAATAVILVLGQPEPEPAAAPARATTGGRGTVVTEENLDEVRAETVEDGYYEARMNVDWIFPTGDAPCENLHVENPTSNKRTVYFDLTLSDTGELVYSSPFIPVGAKLQELSLDKDLPKGDHPAIVTYHLVDDEEQELSTVSVSVTLIVQG